jgi:hypothetical protein
LPVAGSHWVKQEFQKSLRTPESVRFFDFACFAYSAVQLPATARFFFFQM